MKWKEITIGAVATLLVTILGGVGVYYWTKEPDSKKTELLYYSTNQVAAFNGGVNKLGFNVARIHNDGGIPAREVILTIEFPTATITDHSIESSSGIKPKRQTIDKQKAEFTFEALVPSESVTVGLLTSSLEAPKIGLRSNASLGKPDEEKEKVGYVKQKVNKFAAYYIPLAAIFVTILMVYLIRVYRRLSAASVAHENSDFLAPASKNNFAFLLLHQGLMQEAKQILENTIQLGEDGAFALSNLAVCRAKANNVDDAYRLIRAASFYASSKHEEAVVDFNEALVKLIDGDKDVFFSKLREAVAKSPKEIRKYCDYSVHLDEVKSDLRYAETFSAVSDS